MDMQQRHRARQFNNATWLNLQRRNGILRRLRLHQHRLTVFVKCLSDFRDIKLSGCSLNQTHPQSLLQLRNTPTEFGFGLIKRTACRCESSLFDNMHKPCEIIEIQLRHLIVL
ncbi:hypothetical protein D3C73_1091110 [compost metagenome]